MDSGKGAVALIIFYYIIMLYADDMLSLADNELQMFQLDKPNEWCLKCRKKQCNTLQT